MCAITQVYREQGFNQYLATLNEECPGGITEDSTCYDEYLTGTPYCEVDDEKCHTRLAIQAERCEKEDPEAWEKLCALTQEITEDILAELLGECAGRHPRGN